MSGANLITFLQTLAARPDLLDSLNPKSKAEVIATAAELGHPFLEAEFDSLVWDLEVRLAETRGEPFDGAFGLWRTMWGQYYLEYIVTDLLSSLEETGLIPGRSDP